MSRSSVEGGVQLATVVEQNVSVEFYCCTRYCVHPNPRLNVPKMWMISWLLLPPPQSPGRELAAPAGRGPGCAHVPGCAGVRPGELQPHCGPAAALALPHPADRGQRCTGEIPRFGGPTGGAGARL